MTLRGFEDCRTPEDERDQLRIQVDGMRKQLDALVNALELLSRASGSFADVVGDMPASLEDCYPEEWEALQGAWKVAKKALAAAKEARHD